MPRCAGIHNATPTSFKSNSLACTGQVWFAAAALLLLFSGVSWAQSEAGKDRPSVEVDLSVLDELPPMHGEPKGDTVILHPPGSARPADGPRTAERGSPSEPTSPVPGKQPEAEAKPPAMETPPSSAGASRVAEPPPIAPAPTVSASAPRLERAPEQPAPPPAEQASSTSSAPQATEAPARPAETAASPSAAAAAPREVASEAPQPPMTTPVPPAIQQPSNAAGGAPEKEQRAALTGDSGTREQNNPEMFRIVYAAEATEVGTADDDELTAVVNRMKSDGDLRVVIYAYASGTPDAASKARRLSFSRALALRRYLVARGIRGTRAEIRALGNKTDEEPADRVDLVLVKR